MIEEDEMAEEEPEMPAPIVSSLERRIWEIVKKHQGRHAHPTKEVVIGELNRWCCSKKVPLVSNKEYDQAIYNLTHGYTPGLRCTEIVHREEDKEVTEYFSGED